MTAVIGTWCCKLILIYRYSGSTSSRNPIGIWLQLLATGKRRRFYTSDGLLFSYPNGNVSVPCRNTWGPAKPAQIYDLGWYLVRDNGFLPTRRRTESASWKVSLVNNPTRDQCHMSSLRYKIELYLCGITKSLLWKLEILPLTFKVTDEFFKVSILLSTSYILLVYFWTVLSRGIDVFIFCHVYYDLKYSLLKYT